VTRDPGGRASSLTLATLRSAAMWARHYTTAVLSAWQLWPETIETAKLLITEMVANAVQAATPLPEQLSYRDLDNLAVVTVTLRLLPGRVVLEVADDDPRPPVLGSPSEDAENGRGLVLVDALSKEWGYLYPPAGGKLVYAVLGIPTMEGSP